MDADGDDRSRSVGFQPASIMKVAEIEKELRELWKNFSKGSNTEQPITRAQVMNLIVFSANKNADAEISQALAYVSTESPGRMIVLFRDQSLPVSEMNAWVNALCHRASGGRKQVCCEQIMIRAGGRDPLQWSSAVLPLLVPDLPVFLWWSDSLTSDQELLNTLAESSDRLIVDSMTRGSLSIVQQLMKQHSPWLAISDLNWARLTPWRLALANLYDQPECRPCLENITRMEIECTSPNRESAQTDLMRAWLAAGLKWKSLEANGKGEKVALSLQRNRGELELLQRVSLFSPSSEFTVTLADDHAYLRAETFIDGKARGSQLVRIASQTLAEFLRKELSIIGHDQIYESAVRFLA
jgi:glucose-6-phosphate dehydrogenase assembly protein OpcA